MPQRPAAVVDLPAALHELREVTLIAATLARLASRAMRRYGSTPETRALMRRTHAAAEIARDRARAVEEAVRLAGEALQGRG